MIPSSLAFFWLLIFPSFLNRRCIIVRKEKEKGKRRENNRIFPSPMLERMKRRKNS